MNKFERRVKKEIVFKRRLKQLGITERVIDTITRITGRRPNFYCYKSTGKPCSCPNCSPGKIEEKAKYRFNKFDKSKIENEL